MPIIAEAKQYKEFELPAEGTVQAVLAEVVDKGLEDVIYKGIAKKVHKVTLRWQLAELDSEKQPKRVYEKFTLSLDPKAKLYARIKGLFGKEPPASLDLEKIVGTNANLVIIHNAGTDKQGKAKTFANIAATLKLQPGQAKLAIVPIPKKDEVKAEVAKTTNAITEANPITDDDIPF